MTVNLKAAGDISWALRIAARYNITADVTYSKVNGFETKLDVYQPSESGTPKATLMFMHGGGWMEDATKQTWTLWFLPFLQLGWVVVNVGYRSSAVARAPAAVEDCLCALRWIGDNAVRFDIDRKRLVIAGLSAGGLLALTTGMIPSAMSRSDRHTGALGHSSRTSEIIASSSDLVKPVGVINWCGITDISDLVEGPNQQEFVTRWIGDRPDVSRLVSPLTYVCAELPPIVTIHGDHDELVPYTQAVRLHDALSAARVPNKLITLHGAGHAALERYLDAYPQISEFLDQAEVNPLCPS